MKLFIWGTHIDYNDETINVPLFVLTAIDEFNAQFEDSFYKSKEEIENERTMF